MVRHMSKTEIPKLKAVLSDIGDVLFDTKSNAAARRNSFLDIFFANGYNLELGEVMKLYEPFKILGQTVISDEECINGFFRHMGFSETYADFQRRVALVKKPEQVLYSGVTETLEWLHNNEIPFGVVSDASMNEEEISASLRDLLIGQLKSRGVYDSSNFRMKDYVVGFASSKDVGVKKPDEKIFRYGLDRLGYGLRFEETLFVSHESKEIFGAAELGFEVAVFNHRIEDDADEIEIRAREFNKRFNREYARIHIISEFRDICNIIYGQQGEANNEPMGKHL